MPGHDIMVLGGSSGAIECMQRLLPLLPADLAASVFVVIHTSPFGQNRMPNVLGKWTSLSVRSPQDGDLIERGQIYLAPQDHHLLIGEGRVRVVQGPKENNVRPAIDPLFRTAALAYGPRVAGVVLSGLLDDGSSGLRAIKSQGGITIVQDPADAIWPDMPTNALSTADIDYCVTLEKMGPLLAQLARQFVSHDTERPMDKTLAYEAAAANWDVEAVQGLERPGKPSPFSCPDCGGDLWEIAEGRQFHFRCRTGHAFSPLTLGAGQAGMVEDSLNEAYRALLEKVHLEKRLAKRGAGASDRAAYHEHQAKKAESNALVVREMLRQISEIAGESATASG